MDEAGLMMVAAFTGGVMVAAICIQTHSPFMSNRKSGLSPGGVVTCGPEGAKPSSPRRFVGCTSALPQCVPPSFPLDSALTLP